MESTSAVCIEPIGRIAVGNRLGEGIVWDARSGAFVWTDIHERMLFRLFWPSQRLEQFKLPFRLGSFALTGDDDVIVAAFEKGFARYDLSSGSLDWIYRPGVPHGARFNDGRVDREGRFVAGTMVEDAAAAGDPRAGKLYRLDASGHATVLIEEIAITNALCWSPDGATMYHADSVFGTINVYRYPACTGGRALVRHPAGEAPDGATVDAEGRIWVAIWGGSRVAVYSPAGSLLRHVQLPVSQPTCVALGGEDLSVLAITSAHDGLSHEVRSCEDGPGDLLLYRTEATGLEEIRVSL